MAAGSQGLAAMVLGAVQRQNNAHWLPPGGPKSLTLPKSLHSQYYMTCPAPLPAAWGGWHTPSLS